MKKNIFMKAIMLLFVFSFAQATWGQEEAVECLALEYTDGEIDYFALDANPVISYGDGTTISVKQDGRGVYSIEDISLYDIVKYYFEEATPTEKDFTCTIDPKDGAILSVLSQITFSDEEGIYFNEDEEGDYDGDPIYVTDESGEVITSIGSIDPIYDDNDQDIELAQIVKFEESVTEAGKYYVIVPAGFFYNITNSGNKAFNEKMTLIYTIADYPFVVTPADGDSVEEISEIIVACEKGIEWNENQDFYFQVTDPEGLKVFAGVWDAEVNEEAEGDIILSYSLPLYDEEATDNEAITITESGDYMFTIPAGAFYLGEEKILSPETTIYFNIPVPVPEGIGGIEVGNALMTGLEEGAQVYVYTVDGQAVVSATASKDGKVSVDLNSLKGGQVYILRTPKASYKIVK